MARGLRSAASRRRHLSRSAVKLGDEGTLTVVVREIERLLLANLHAVAPSSLLGEALPYLHGQWPKLVRFPDNGT